jgi:hypothetical protein
MPARLPLSALLSQALVAFSIECDNEFERRMPHRTSNYGGSEGPWLVSMTMWWNCLRFVGEQGVQVGELGKLARTETNLRGMERWGYVTVAPDPDDRRAKPPASAWIIRTKLNGRKAKEIGEPLSGSIEERWGSRFGAAELGRLREVLHALADRIPFSLPDCLPILGYGLSTKGRFAAGEKEQIPPDMPLPALLSRALIAFADEFETESDLSLAISADVVRVLDETGVRQRDIPQLGGVSKEAIAMAMGILQKMKLVEAKERFVRLTSKGLEAQKGYTRLVSAIEKRWEKDFGIQTILRLRDELEHLSGKLFLGLEPYPDNWRARVPKPEVLPHYPMVLHRGGYPDGS